VNAESDPYLASAIEFMYSEDTEEDFNTLGRQQQEELLKKTWMEREKQFYGEELDDSETRRREGTIQEQPENEEQDDSSDDDLDRNVPEQSQPSTEPTEPLTPSASSDATTMEVQSRYQVMKQKQQKIQSLQDELKHKQ